MTSRNEASDIDLAGQAEPVVEPDEETPGAEIVAGDRADVTDVVEQHQGVPDGEDDYDR